MEVTIPAGYVPYGGSALEMSGEISPLCSSVSTESDQSHDEHIDFNQLHPNNEVQEKNLGQRIQNLALREESLVRSWT
ncbi:hypothetical protein AOLI_G00067220 [Acnodon oligacanthus]